MRKFRDEENFIERSLYYWAELYSQQLLKGAEYCDLRQTICINILEENLFKDDRFWRTHHMSDDEAHEILTRMEEIHFLELKKMRGF
jgi:predicted transposase/invertase (TIGR01784 family)